jgi:tripartite-type tricarboxylate transporter receptor subunit TctC
MKKNSLMSSFLATLPVIVSLSVVHLTPAAAENPAAFYKGKTMELNVGSSPGGGYDTWGRLMAPALGKMIGATVIVKNQPAAGGVVALNDIYHLKNARGLKIHIARDVMPALMEATDFPGTSARWEVSKLKWLARITTDSSVLAGNPKKYKSLADVKKAKQFLCGVDAAMSVSGTRTTLGLHALGLKNAWIVAGYPGGSERRLAVMMGELDGTSGSYDSLVKYITAGDLKPIWVMSKERIPQDPSIPTIYELATDEGAKKWLDWLFLVQDGGRSFVAPPDTPMDRVNFLRDAMDKIVKDPEFLKQVAKVKYSVDYLRGDKLEAVLEKAMQLNKKEKEELIHILKVQYVK